MHIYAKSHLVGKPNQSSCIEIPERPGAKASAAAAGVSSAAANASTQPPATCQNHTRQ